MKRDLYSRISTVILCFFITVLAVNAVMGFLCYPVHTKTDSMMPDIPDNSVVLVSPLLKKAERGQIILVETARKEKLPFFKKILNSTVSFFTARQCSPFESGTALKPSLRRVIGFPGDELYISNYLVYVKPSGEQHFLTEFELTKIDYNLTVGETSAGTDQKIGALGNMEKLTLKEGEYFVLSDNRLEGIDSRIWGPVTNKNIRGRALFVYLPFNKARFF
jgi:signal peptidase I